MGKTKAPYPTAFKQQIVELAGAGRGIGELAREFGVNSQSINHWIAQAAGGTNAAVPASTTLNSDERAELARLRRENRQLKQERDILSKATAWFANKSEGTSNVSTS